MHRSSGVVLSLAIVATLFIFPGNAAARKPWGALDGLSPSERAYLEARIFVASTKGTRSALPSRVVNTQYLPAVTSQGQLGVCGAYGITYYYKTYQEAREHNWGRPDPDVDPEHCASTAYTYKLLRHGPQAGASSLAVAQNIVDFGVCTWAEMPYSDSITTTTWPEAEYWRKAAPWRAKAAGIIPRLHLPEGRRALKAHLAGNDLAVISVIAAPGLFSYPDGGDTSNDVIYELDDGATGVSHALTVIGFDDAREYLDDRTGRLERGAFLCVNSWGTDWGIEEPTVGTRGFCWLAYDLFDGVDARANAVVMLDRIAYIPKLLVNLGLFHSESKLFGTLMTSGRGDQTIDLFPGLGMDEKLTDQELWIDVSDLIAYGRAGFSLSLRDFSDASGTVNRLGVHRWDQNHALEPPNLPVQTRNFMSTMASTDLYVGRYQKRMDQPHLPIRNGDAAWADADGDGDPDLVVTGWFGGNAPGGRTTYLENDGTGQLLERSRGFSAGHTVRWVDADNDADYDLVIGGTDATRLYLNDGSGGFVQAAHVLPPSEPGCVAVADFDHDGRADLCIGSTEGTWICVNQPGGFTRLEVGLPALRLPSAAVRGSRILSADVTGDGWSDLVVAGMVPDGASGVFVHQGLPIRFERGPGPLPTVGAPAVAAADYDGDGALDLAVSGCSDGPQTRLLRNLGDGRFESLDGVLLPNLHDGNLCWTDVNADGAPDLILTGREKDVFGSYEDRLYTNATMVLTQAEDGTFEPFGPPLPEVSRGVLSTADVDGDGNADIALGGTVAQIFETTSEKLTSAVFLHGAAFPGWYDGNSPPSPPTGRVADADAHGGVVFHWDDAGDLETPATALRYVVRCGTVAQGNDVVSGAVPHDAQGLHCASGYRLRHVPAGRLYWQVRTVDGAGVSSSWSPVQTVDVPTHTPRHYLELTVDPPYAGDTVPAAGVSVHEEGALVTVNAVAAAGYRFRGWEGDDEGIPDTVTTQVSMDSDRRLRARFAPNADPERPAWTLETDAMTAGHTVVGHTLESFGGRLLRLGGRVGWTARNLVYVSDDGQTWRQLWQLAFEQGLYDWDDVPWDARYGHCSAVFDGRLWVLGGDGGWDLLSDVWCTDDLFNWSRLIEHAPWPERANAGCAVFEDKLWVLGGEGLGANLGDVWASVDGATWIHVTDDAPWPAGPVQAVAFNGSLVVHARGQIWRSDDGVDWECLLSIPPFGERTGCSLEVFGGNLVLSGGRDWYSWNVVDDVWMSPDGVAWTQTAPTSDVHWSARRGPASCLHEGRLWLIGGRDSDDSALDDVWSLGSSALPSDMGRLVLSVHPTSGGRLEPPGDTSYVDELGTVFSLKAAPAPGYSFDRWEGPVSSLSDASTTVTLTRTTQVAAHFVATDVPLNVHVSPRGGGSVSPGSVMRPRGTVVTLEATPAFGYVFECWEGDVTGSSRMMDLVLDGPRSVTAVFVPDPTLPSGTIACSDMWAAVLRSDGTLWAVGVNDKGRQGHELTAPPDAFWPVAICSGVRGAYVSDSGGLAITDSGALLGWGETWAGTGGYEVGGHPVYTYLPSGIRACAGMRTHLFIDRNGALFDGLNRGIDIGYNGEDLANITAVAEGPDSTFAATRTGILYAWGDNSCGQLGTASGLPFHEYAQPVSGISGVRRMACGSHSMHAFTLALTDDGRVWSWGDNAFGQLGRPVDAAHPAHRPGLVSGLSGIIKIAAGARHAVALDRDGRLHAWGDNTFGQLGVGDHEDRSAPCPVPGTMADVGAGPLYTLVRERSGVFAWSGQVPGADEPLTSFAEIAGLTDEAPVVVLDVACEPTDMERIHPSAGRHYVAVDRPIPLTAEDTERHEFAYWSDEVDDPLSANTTLRATAATAVTVHYRYKPEARARLTVQAGAGGRATPSPGVHEYEPGTVVTLRADPDAAHRFRCWEGDVTDPRSRTTTIVMDRDHLVSARFSSSELRPDPQIVTGRINVMEYDGLVLYSDGHVADYGATAWGSTIRLNPDSDPLDDVAALAVGETHELALAKDGTVWAWGDNAFGQCASGDVVPAVWNFPRKVQTPAGVLGAIVAIDAAGQFSLALDVDGQLWSWGRNQFGQLGNSAGTDVVATAQRVTGVDGAPLHGIDDMACGRGFALAVTEYSEVLAWGRNDEIQLGVPGDVGGAMPSRVSGLPPIVKVAAGGACVAALSVDGDLWTWGRNDRGQLGHGTQGDAESPARVVDIPPIRDVAVGPEHMLAVDVNGRVWAWGRGDLGQLGNGQLADSSVPVPVLDQVSDRQLGNVRAIACHQVSYAIAQDGSLLQWGYDRSLFGDGSDCVSRPWRRLDLGRFTTHDKVRCVQLTCFPHEAGLLSPGAGLVFVNAGTLLDIRAMPSSGYRFMRWEGDVSSSLSNVTIRVTEDMDALARFALSDPELRVEETVAVAGGIARMGVYLDGDTAALAGVQIALECPAGLQFGPAHRGMALPDGGSLVYSVPDPRHATIMATAAEGQSSLQANSEFPLFSVDVNVLPTCPPGDYVIDRDAGDARMAVTYASGSCWETPRFRPGTLRVEPGGGLTLMVRAAPAHSPSGDVTHEDQPASLNVLREDREYVVELWLQDLRTAGRAVTGACIDLQLDHMLEAVQVEGTGAVGAVSGTIDPATGTVEAFGGSLLEGVVIPGSWICVSRLRVRPTSGGESSIDICRESAVIGLDGGASLMPPAVHVLPAGDLQVAHTANVAPTARREGPLSGIWGAQIAGSLSGSDPNEDDTLAYTIVDGPQHGELVSFDSSTGAFTYLPDASHSGADRIMFTVSDGTLVSAPEELRLFVSRGWCATLTRGGAWCMFGQDETASDAVDAVDLVADSELELLCDGPYGGPRLQRDLRGVDVPSVWRVIAPAASGPTVLTWDSTEIPEGFHLVQVAPAVDEQIVVDLSRTQALELAGETEYVLDIAMLETYTLMLNPGWNLVALPGTPAFNEVQSLFGEASRPGGDTPARVLGWTERFHYRVTRDLAAFVGYWVYADGPESYDLSLIPAFVPAITLRRGWNLIGVPFPTRVGDLVGVSGCAWYYAEGRYQPAIRLLPGTGYWVYAMSGGTMTFVEEDAP